MKNSMEKIIEYGEHNIKQLKSFPLEVCSFNQLQKLFNYSVMLSETLLEAIRVIDKATREDIKDE